MAFRDCLEVCELEDLGFSRFPYTYDNGQPGDRNVQVRLDRAVVDEAWRDLFLLAKVVHLALPCSDHRPVLVQLQVGDEPRRQRPPPRYEIMWEWQSALPGIIEEAWAKKRHAGNLGEVANSLKSVMSSLRTWGAENFGHITKKIEKRRA